MNIDSFEFFVRSVTNAHNSMDKDARKKVIELQSLYGGLDPNSNERWQVSMRVADFYPEEMGAVYRAYFFLQHVISAFRKNPEDALAFEVGMAALPHFKNVFEAFMLKWSEV